MKVKLSSIIKPFVPAAVTGAIVFSCATAPVLQPVPERLPEPVRSEKNETPLLDSTRPERETTSNGDAAALVKAAFVAPKGGYADGVYTGSARGFGGMITVQVTIRSGAIADVSVVSAPGETTSYLSRANSVTGRIVSAQSPNVDTVSGATYSSNGIINAVKAALSKAGASEADEPEPEAEPEKPQTPETRPNFGYPDGTYIGSGEGFGGDIVVRVTVSGGQIIAVDVLEAEDETEPFFTNAKAVLDTILTRQTADVDAISGATFSSEGLKDAVRSALAGSHQLTVQPEEASEPQPVVPQPVVPEPVVPEPAVPEPVMPDPGTDPITPTETVTVKTETYTGTGTVMPDEYEDFTVYTVTLTLTVEEKTTTVQDGDTETVTTERTIQDVSVTGATGKSNLRYLNTAMKGMRAALLAGNAEADAVSGATCSSEGIRAAYRSALSQANLGTTQLVSALPPAAAKLDGEGEPSDE